MDIIRKIQYLLFCLLAIGFVACDDDDNNSTETGHEGILTQLAEEVDATAQQLWSSSPLIRQHRHEQVPEYAITRHNPVLPALHPNPEYYFQSVHFWIDVLAMILFGLGIGVLICFLGGLMAVDIAPRNASGAALGVVGIASYIGAGLQDVMSGVLIEGQKTVQNGVDVYDFTYINWFWIGAALLSVLFALLVWNAKSKVVG